MFWIRSCPRCRGDLYQDRDHFGFYLRCIQCGHEIQLTRMLRTHERISPVLLEQVRLSPVDTQTMAESRRRRSGLHRKLSRLA